MKYFSKLEVPKSNKRTQTMNEYFNARGLDKNTYQNYKIPQYLLDILPVDKNIQILDIGSGLGQFLEALRKNGYSNIQGVDINIEAIEHCKNNGLKVKKISHITDIKGKYNFITMMHVLEHFPKEEIINTLSFIKKNLLTEEGEFFIAVPNAQSNTDCYWAYEDFTHNFLFTAGSLKYVLYMAGFKNIVFIDKDCLAGIKIHKKIIKKILLYFYKLNKKFWNKVTNSFYHSPSPQIFSYEIKALIKNHKN